MERWRGRRAGVTGEKGRNRNKVKSYGKERRERGEKEDEVYGSLSA